MAVAGIALFGLVLSTRAQEAAVGLDQVPKVIMDSARAKFPAAKIKAASKETENGKTVFELEMTNENRNMDVTFEENGTLAMVETSIPEAEASAAAIKAVKDRYPGAKINLVESVKKGAELKREVDYFEFHLTAADKKSVEVEVDPAGKILKTEVKTEADEKG